MNLKPIEKKITELEQKEHPVNIRVFRELEEAGTYEHNGQVYTEAEYQAMTVPGETVIIVSRA